MKSFLLIFLLCFTACSSIKIPSREQIISYSKSLDDINRLEGILISASTQVVLPSDKAKQLTDLDRYRWYLHNGLDNAVSTGQYKAADAYKKELLKVVKEELSLLMDYGKILQKEEPMGLF